MSQAPVERAEAPAGAPCAGPRVGIDWAVEPSRSGEPTLRLGDRYVHSRYAPRREAADLARRTREEGGGSLILLGLGLGYLPEALVVAGAPDVVAFDPCPAVTRAAAGAATSEPAGAGRESWRTRIPVARSLEELDRFLGRVLARGRAPRLLVHPGYGDLCRFERRWISRRLRERAGRPARLRARDAVVSRRALDALERLPYRRALPELAGVCEGRTALCVSPGPSLDAAALAALAARRGGVLFAALQATRRLQEAGVRVDFVVAPDPYDFEPLAAGVTADFGALLADTSVHPGLLDRWADRTVLFHLRTPHLHGLAWEGAGLPVLDEPVMTVSETMLVLAHRLGAARAVMVGMDFCGAAERYRGLRLRAADACGRSVETNHHYWAAARFLSWWCPERAREARPVHRLGHGLAVSGARPAGAADLAALAGEDGPPALPSPGPVRCERRFRAAAEAIRRAARTAGPTAPRPHEGESRGARRHEDFHPLAPGARRRALAASLARLEADPTPGGR